MPARANAEPAISAVPVLDADELCSQRKPGFLRPQPNEWPLHRKCHVDDCNRDATHEPNSTGVASGTQKPFPASAPPPMTHTGVQ